MTQPVIQVRDLSKSYQIRATSKKPYHSLRDDLMDGFKNLVKGQWRSQQTETFWALKDINFDVNQGDVVGIIGRNGAGKSTLLKILSQIVQPTTGEITIRGRVGSLLEVGTGFHPELTGRENIFMNGAILGMKRSEIVRKFDEIVAFAEVEQFLDTPVKFYSSGMYVRLAFAVAAHLEPEVLIVDEVLAVGDAQFQKKCLGKMGEVSKSEGKTVLFVSHNMTAIQRLCKECILLELGKAKDKLSTQTAIGIYLNQSSDIEKYNIYRSEEESIIVKKIFFYKGTKTKNEVSFTTSDIIKIYIKYEVKIPLENVCIGIWFMTVEGFVFMSSHDVDMYPNLKDNRSVGEYINTLEIPSKVLNSGEYRLRVLIYIPYGKVYFDDSSLYIQIADTNESSLSKHRVGLISPNFEWQVDFYEE